MSTTARAREMIRSRKSVAACTRQTLAVKFSPAPWRSCTSTVEPEEVTPPNTRAVMTELAAVPGGIPSGTPGGAAGIPDIFGAEQAESQPRHETGDELYGQIVKGVYIGGASV